MHNNPISLIDPTGMSADTVRFNTISEDGSKNTFAQINTSKVDAEFNIPIDAKSQVLVGLNPLVVDESVIRKYDADGMRSIDAIAFDISGASAKGLGVQGQFSVVGITSGIDKGQWGILFQGSGLIGLESGVGGSLSIYSNVKDNGGDLFLSDLKGWEYGLQYDVTLLPGTSLGSSYFYGKSSTTGRRVYEGTSVAVSPSKNYFKGSPVSGSGYVGYSWLLHRSSLPKP